MATDGYHTVQDDSDGPFTIPLNPPEVEITSPGNGAWFRPGEKIGFRSLVTDTEDESIPANNHLWTYNGISFGAGPETEAVLPEGAHTITLTVFDSDGMQGSDTLEILVAEPCYGDFDDDGDVDGSDLKTLGDQLGCEGACPADFDGNKIVDEVDVELFARDYGRNDCPIPVQ